MAITELPCYYTTPTDNVPRYIQYQYWRNYMSDFRKISSYRSYTDEWYAARSYDLKTRYHAQHTGNRDSQKLTFDNEEYMSLFLLKYS